jgi:hypothetical protein
MRRLATVSLVLAGLLVATVAFAVDFNHKSTLPAGPEPGQQQLQFALASVLACDDGNPASGYYQWDTARYGNIFTLPAGTRLSAVEFAHYGFGFSGPYDYDLEMWDATSCTMIAEIPGLVAQDAASGIGVEQVYLCPFNLVMGGNVIVAIDANTCPDPTDCYPDLLFDDQVGVFCPFIVDATTGECVDVSANGGPFLLRLEINGCPVPALPRTWGSMKSLYR